MQSKRNPTASAHTENPLRPPFEDDSSESIGDERRETDRRLRPTRPWSGMFGPLRRARGRRRIDHTGYVDQYSRRDVVLLLTVFLLIVQSLGGDVHAGLLVQQVVLCGLWLSFGVFIVDAILDVWFGAATPARMRRAYLYYVQIFEQWKNWGVLLAFFIVVVIAPAAYFSALVPAAAVAFAAWLGVCLLFATFWNQILYPAGSVTNKLPLPMVNNRYSATDPTWAYFFQAIHLVMAVSLGVGVLGMNGVGNSLW